MRPQHGMVNYPCRPAHHAASLDADSCDEANRIFDEIAVPVSRLRDPVQMVGFGKCLEIPYVFRDFSKDPDDPSNYFLPNTRAFVRRVAADVPTVMIRLGAPREIWGSRYNKKPADYDTFARVCTHLVRFVNEGWGGGLTCGVKYWEIWNRADSKWWWPEGSAEEYYRLYATVAKAIKALDPRLKVGGPAAADCGGDNRFLKDFLACVKKNRLPCDFVSWNYYGYDPAEARRQAKEVRRIVSEAGLSPKPEIVCDEWNAVIEKENGFFDASVVGKMRGAAFDAAFLAILQKEKTAFSTFAEPYPNLPNSGLYSKNTIRPLKPLYAFLAFSRVFRLGREVKSAVKGENLYSVASSDGKDFAGMISVYEPGEETVRVSTGSRREKTVFLLDETHDLTPVLTTRKETFEIPLHGYSVILVTSKS